MSGISGVPDRLRVGMPMLNLVPGGMGGTETYLRELTRCLSSYDDLDVHAFVPLSASGSTVGVAETVVDSVVGGARARERLTAIGRAATSRSVRRQVHEFADVLHYPFTVPVPPPVRPYAITLHDIQHLDMPEFFSSAERAYRRWAYDRAARRADVVITDSEFCKGRIVHHLGVPASRVTVAHLAPAPDFSPRRCDRGAFVLYPARRWPHKNHERLLAAMSMLKADRPDLRLVLTGGGAPLPDAPEWVEQRGLVSRDELMDLYATAGCLAFPSLYEGFGLPPLEAMASGCPVALSGAGSLPEICGDAGIMFDPLDVTAMARAIGEALDSGECLAEKGRKQAALFTWERCAEVHAGVYRGLAGR